MAKKNSKQTEAKTPEIAAKPAPVSEPKGKSAAVSEPKAKQAPVADPKPEASADSRPAAAATSARPTTVDPRGNKAVTHEQIARRAFEIYRERGATPGRSMDDWLKAEKELKGS